MNFDHGKRLGVFVSLVFSVGVSSCARLDEPPGGWETVDVIVKDVSLVSMQSDGVLQNHAVAIAQDRIVWIGASDAVPPTHTATLIDGEGGYVLPGLIDLHVHVSERDLPLFVAAGITTVLFKHGAPEHLEWRAEVERGERSGPRIFSTGPMIAGREIHWPHAVAHSAADASTLVREHADAGYDFIKVYDFLTPDAYEALAATADTLGIPFLGHLPADRRIETALAAGQHCIDHVEQLIYAAIGRDRSMEASSGEIDAIAETVARGGGCVTSTLFGMKTMMMRGSMWFDSLYTRPEMAFVDSGTRAWWNSFRGAEPSAEVAARRTHFYESQRYLTKRLSDAGVLMVAGTDTPNLLLIPGFALHDELRLLVDDVGLTPFEALQAVTIHAAAMLGRPTELGVVAAGGSADLILVADNPLEDIDIIRHPKGVMAQGRWHDRQDLNRLLEAARDATSP